MKRRIKYGAVAVSLLVFCILVHVVLEFLQDGRPTAVEELPAPAQITVMAPFEIREHRETMEKIAAEYSALPGKPEVKLEFFSQDVYQKEICMEMDQGELADIIICENVMMPSLVDIGVFQDITDEIEREKKESRYYINFWSNTRSDGRIYGVPFTCDPAVIFYNKGMFEQKDLEVPQTWEELIQTSGAVQKLGTYALGMAFMPSEEVVAVFLQNLYAAGASIREINSEDGFRVFEFLEKLRVKNLVHPESLNWNQTDLADAFMGGKAAMAVGSLSMAAHLEKASEELEIGVMRLPIDRRAVYMLHGKNVGITVDADMGEALDFLDYLTSYEISNRIAKELHTVPVWVGGEYDYDQRIALDEEWIDSLVSSSMSKSSFSSWFIISAEIADGVKRIFYSDEEIRSIADDMQDKVRIAIIEQ